MHDNQFGQFADPLFFSATSDWHIQPGSAAINNGTTLSEVTTDFDGRPRPTPGQGYDIGAYQH
jgi:hypothetical protein